MEKIKITTPNNTNYPQLLKEIHKPPSPLYYRGTMPENDTLLVAIVGSRKSTNYGRKVTSQIVKALTESGITIISGLAFGIDITAHIEAMRNGGKTIAVLANGLDQRSIAPASHQEEAQIILAAGGALLSEYKEGTPAYKGNYHARNRIISGIAKATIVIECRRKSGTMITANTALSQNREVFALPGAITSPNSEGPNQLIREGATPIVSISSLLEDLNVRQPNQQTIPQINLSPDEFTLLEIISTEPQQIHKITQKISWPIQRLTKTISSLEIKSQITIQNNGYISKT